MNDRALLVDDEAAVRTALVQTFEIARIDASAVASVDEALALIDRDWPGAVVTDMRMPRRTGADLLDAVQEIDPAIPVIVLTGQGDIPMAVKAMNAGAYDFLEKPCEPDRLVEVVRRACEKRRLVCENRALRKQLERADGAGTPDILGQAPATLAYRETLARIAATDLDVLVLGETGAGKELAARALHHQSERSSGPFVAVNCGALPADLAGSELFGHEKGAFTGATTRRIGKFEHADSGTILLDEIESMPLDLQVKLLRILQERELERLGGNAAVPLDIRVVAASKADLRDEVQAGRFREDLFFRLDVARVRIPSMRERVDDAPLLFRAFVNAVAIQRQVEAPLVTPTEDAVLLAHDWPGNVRELKNAAERFAMGLGLRIGDGNGSDPSDTGLNARMEVYEKAVIEAALREAGGRVAEACDVLNIPRKTLYDKLKRHGLAADRFRTR